MSDFEIGQQVTPIDTQEWETGDGEFIDYHNGDSLTIMDIDHDEVYDYTYLDLRIDDTYIYGVEADCVMPIDGFKESAPEFAHVARNRRLNSTTSGTKNVKAGTTVEVTKAGNYIHIRRLSDGLVFRNCNPDTVIPLGTPVAA